MAPYVNLPKRPGTGPSSPVLVAVISRQKDLGIVKRERWYRIPVKSAPRGRADYLALYQTKGFGDEGESINYYAKIWDCQVVKRRELLPDEEPHPRGDNDYYKLTLGNILRTPHKIYNETRRRVTFLFTTMEKLKKAGEITDLYVRNPAEEILWTELKKNMINASPQHYVFEKGRCVHRLDFAIFCRNGKVNVECDGRSWHERYEDQIKDKKRDNFLTSRGWMVLRFPAKELFKNAKDCVNTIKQTISTLGGQE